MISKYRIGFISFLLGVLVVGASVVVPRTALAVDNGPTISPSACMQRVFNGPTANVTSSNKLNCTANDIRLSRAISVSPETCIEGQKFDLTATFETVVTANSRYDAGFFFRTDGGANARGDGPTATGTCSLSALNPAIPPALDPGDGDTCGDLNSGTYELTFTIQDVTCHDSDKDGFLNLPNCTSWHSNQGTACNITDQFRFRPDTKSKCVCDDTFQVPVQVESPSGAVVKTATKAVVTYEVKVKNNSSGVTVKIDSLTDDVYGDITQVQGEVKTTNCGDLIGDSLAPGATSDACTFTVEYANPGTEGDIKDIITAVVEDTQDADNKSELTGTVTINIDLAVGP